MIETLDKIGKASESWWRWLLWIPRSRSLVQYLVAALKDVPTQEKLTRDTIHKLEIDLAVAVEKCARLDTLEATTSKALADQQNAMANEQNARIEADAAKGHCKILQQECEQARSDKLNAEARIVVLESEVADFKSKTAELEKVRQDNTEAIVHLVRWIRTTHRVMPMPEPGTIKELLLNAQKRN